MRLGGSPVIATSNISFAPIVEGGPAGEFRASASGADSGLFQITPGESSTTIYYVNSSSSTETVDFDTSVVLIAPWCSRWLRD